MIFNGLHLFQEQRRRVRTALFAANKTIFEGAGVFVFLDIGMSTTLFHKVDTPSLTAFARGTWDDALPRLTRVTPV